MRQTILFVQIPERLQANDFRGHHKHEKRKFGNIFLDIEFSALNLHDEWEETLEGGACNCHGGLDALLH